MDYSIYTEGDRVFFEMDKDTAWLFAQRMGEVIEAPADLLEAVKEEIYGCDAPLIGPALVAALATVSGR